MSVYVYKRECTVYNVQCTAWFKVTRVEVDLDSVTISLYRWYTRVYTVCTLYTVYTLSHKRTHSLVHMHIHI